MPATWILVADSARARLFSLNADGDDPDEIEAFANAEGRMPGRELERDRPPRTHDRFGAGRHAIEPHTSPQDKSTTRFAQLLQSVLERGRVEHSYDNLVLIAPPRFLGALNTALDRQVRACVSLEIHKDLTHANARTIGTELQESLRQSTQ